MKNLVSKKFYIIDIVKSDFIVFQTTNMKNFSMFSKLVRQATYVFNIRIA